MRKGASGPLPPHPEGIGKTRWSLKGKGVEMAMGTIRMLAPSEVHSRSADFLRRLAGDQGQGLALYGGVAACIPGGAFGARGLPRNHPAPPPGNIPASFSARPR